MFKVNGIPVQIERYPDGTPRLNIESNDERIAMIEWLYEKDEEMILFFIAKHLREQCPSVNITLRMPYIPHARMDRVKDGKEVFTLKYFCEFVNSLRFESVTVRDPHSYVSMALLNNVIQEPVSAIIKRLAARLLDPRKDVVFYPDEGSCKRYSDISGIPYAFGIKKRDWSTGKITSLDVYGDIPSKPFNVLIVDDISSYGGTYLHSAKKLKELGAGKIYLYVTHCENSILNGELIGSDLLTKIYTTRSIFTGPHPLIEIIGDGDE